MFLREFHRGGPVALMGVPQQSSPKLGAQMPPLLSILTQAQAPLSQEQTRALDQGLPVEDSQENPRRNP